MASKNIVSAANVAEQAPAKPESAAKTAAAAAEELRRRRAGIASFI
jgi:hypothetical protein